MNQLKLYLDNVLNDQYGGNKDTRIINFKVSLQSWANGLQTGKRKKNNKGAKKTGNKPVGK